MKIQDYVIVILGIIVLGTLMYLVYDACRIISNPVYDYPPRSANVYKTEKHEPICIKCHKF